jgi:hypothetical protein
MARKTAAQLEVEFNQAVAALRAMPASAHVAGDPEHAEYVHLRTRATRLQAEWIRAERREQRDGEMS